MFSGKIQNSIRNSSHICRCASSSVCS